MNLTSHMTALCLLPPGSRARLDPSPHNNHDMHPMPLRLRPDRLPQGLELTRNRVSRSLTLSISTTSRNNLPLIIQ